jgi:hypothetical protein
LNFSLKLYPGHMPYVDAVLGAAAQGLRDILGVGPAFDPSTVTAASKPQSESVSSYPSRLPRVQPPLRPSHQPCQVLSPLALSVKATIGFDRSEAILMPASMIRRGQRLAGSGEITQA